MLRVQNQSRDNAAAIVNQVTFFGGMVSSVSESKVGSDQLHHAHLIKNMEISESGSIVKRKGVLFACSNNKPFVQKINPDDIVVGSKLKSVTGNTIHFEIQIVSSDGEKTPFTFTASIEDNCLKTSNILSDSLVCQI